MTDPVLSLEGVSLSYRSVPVLSDLSLAVRSGETLALLGRSGSGKTSALRLILGFIAPDRGRVRVAGAVASEDGRIRIPPEERGVAIVFQDLALWPHLTVEGNLGFGLEAKGMRREERQSRIAGMLGRVGLDGKERRFPGELSGGERQRVALARALVLEPAAVLFDEPLTNLDVALKREMIGLLGELLAERSATALYVTHDVREAAALGHRIAILEAGRVVQAGTLDHLRARPADGFVASLVEEFG